MNLSRYRTCRVHAISVSIILLTDGSVGKASACNAGDPSLIPELGRSPGEGNGNPLQHSCLENPMDRGAWRAAVHGVTEFLKDSSTKHMCKINLSGKLPFKLNLNVLLRIHEDKNPWGAL